MTHAPHEHEQMNGWPIFLALLGLIVSGLAGLLILVLLVLFG